MRSDGDVARNAARAEELIREAVAGGAGYVQTPEVTNLIPESGAALADAIHAQADDPTLARMRALAAELEVTIHLGSLAVRAEGDGDARAANRAFLIGPDGAVLATYDKIHMFEADLGEKGRYREAARYRPGTRAVVADCALGRLGLGICYDMRFPALWRAMAKAGAQVLSAPSAFTVPTGEAHWHVLLRARAVETGCWMLAAAQWGRHGGTDEGTLRESYGHSLIVDPWGRVVADGGEGEGVVAAEIDLGAVEAARARIGSLTQDRPFDL